MEGATYGELSTKCGAGPEPRGRSPTAAGPARTGTAGPRCSAPQRAPRRGSARGARPREPGGWALPAAPRKGQREQSFLLGNSARQLGDADRAIGSPWIIFFLRGDRG